MNKKIKKILVIVSIIIIILGIILGVGVSNNIINSTNRNLYVDGKDFSDIMELTSFIGSKVLGFVIVIYSILLDCVIWIVYGIIILILKLINMAKDLMIRSSSAEFLIFERQTHDKGIQVRFEDGDLWLTQKAIGELFNIDRTVVTKHIKNIYSELELNEDSTSANFALVQKEGNREITRNVLFYNLDMVISVGYKVNSDRAIQFRRWATKILKEYMTKGFALNDERFINGNKYDTKYFNESLERIKIIRVSERMSYQKITDLFIATSTDYSPKSEETYTFFKIVQNKLRYVICF